MEKKSKPAKVSPKIIGKGEFVELIRSKSNMTIAQSNDMFDSIIELLTTTIKSGGQARLPTLGTFLMVDSPARSVRNPKTGEHIDLPASQRVKFRASKTGFAKPVTPKKRKVIS